MVDNFDATAICTSTSSTDNSRGLVNCLQKLTRSSLGLIGIGTVVGGGLLAYSGYITSAALVPVLPIAGFCIYGAMSLPSWSHLLGACNYYTVLGVGQNASVKEITAAYRQLALQCHPDLQKQGKPVDAELFKLIVRAYAILRDPELRQQYDLGGDAAVEYYLKHAREKPGIREVWKWDFLAPWNNSSKELPSLSEMFRRASQYDLYTRLEHAVAMGQPELPNEVVECLQNLAYSTVASAVQLAITSSFQCSVCNQPIHDQLEEMCYCLKRSSKYTHHRKRCCHKGRLVKKFKKRVSTISSGCQNFVNLFSWRSDYAYGIPLAGYCSSGKF